jgi:protein-tyrosine-phosphatase
MGLELLQERGGVLQRNLKMACHIVFVCVSNRVRSVFAEFYFTRMLREKDERLLEEVRPSSAGFIPKKLGDLIAKGNITSPEPFYNRAMSEIAREALRKKGILAPTNWRSKELTSERVMEADLVITALVEQKKDLLNLFPQARDKILTAREIAKWDDYLLHEDFSGVPMDDSFWDYCEENPDYVDRVISEMEGILKRAFPYILLQLGIEA